MKFSDLESPNYAALSEEHQSSLIDWYRKIRNVPISELEIGDVCKAVRQRLFVAHVLPVANSHLSNDICAGDDYDGQLIASITALTSDDWAASPTEAHVTKRLLQNSLRVKELNSNIRRDIEIILLRLAEA